ncbi:MAG: type II glyceraldehyde-3-phosphate dehydrogenase [Nanoarchaeota archaeon]|nr:type II glyceraldehyde-3-phosphate dehydrogenase [Nanoarchaeota archaeon]
MIKVGIVGFGTIGKRIADAVLLQKDMKLAGVTAHSYNYRIVNAHKRGISIFSHTDKDNLITHGIPVAGDINALCEEADIIVDCAPKPYGMENREKIYEPNNIKAILQGGEKAHAAEVSFVAQCNYQDAIDKDYVRVVSCNTTGLARTIKALDAAFGVDFVRATLIRRAADPGQTKKGPINSIIPSLELPSHHGPDVRTVLPHIEVFTTAVIVPTTLMHMHNLSVVLKNGTRGVEAEDVLKLFEKTPRVRVVHADQGILGTAEVMEYARDLGGKRSDMMDICVWDKGLGMHHGELFFVQAVHQESDVVPENIDCIRAMLGEEDAEKSMALTNKSLGMKH